MLRPRNPNLAVAADFDLQPQHSSGKILLRGLKRDYRKALAIVVDQDFIRQRRQPAGGQRLAEPPPQPHPECPRRWDVQGLGSRKPGCELHFLPARR